MSVLYAGVFREDVRGGKDLVGQHAVAAGNFEEVAGSVVDKLEADAGRGAPKKMTLTSGDGWVLHYSIVQRMIYVIITDDRVPDRSFAFDFLDRVSGYALAGGPVDWRPILSKEIVTTNASIKAESGDFGGNEKVVKVKGEVARVKRIMVQNIEAVVQRGERLERLADDAEHLQQNSVTFRQTSRAVARRMWFENVKMWIVVVLVVAIILYSIVVASCGGFLLPNCVGRGGNVTLMYE